MEDLISNFNKTLAPFCNHLQNSCNALKQSVDRRPIPLDSASSTFIQSLNRRVSAVSVDLSLLESRSLETVSLEELLGHVSEVYKKNESDLQEIQKQLKGVGYVPEFEIDEEDENYNHALTSGLRFELSSSKDGLNIPSSYQRSVSMTGLAKHNFEDDILLDDSLSLQNAGLSDVCLATLASEGNSRFDDPYADFHTPKKFLGKPLDSNFPCQSAAQIGVSEAEEGEDYLKYEEAISPSIKLSKDDFESIPSYMKSLASWEDLIVAVEKINSCLKMKAKGENYIFQDEVSSMGLGPKARSFLMILVRMKRVVVETVDDQISYRVL
ncbi:uncharacterized protein LOC111800703 isoform X1 [Cucurbita pepo subsp. pepo]|uniref:uncharacterized protein LOC111800703 isoform X1 n=1 Tax=Cucurbita pepo subsp. pepo TaxID=3664 RepID=UPI000C9DA6DD|nr:uncharacterized protein LOC111800703 isoform X1 [Cucurbita pepo subsp. pepo]